MKIIKKPMEVLLNDEGQSATEYMVLLVLAITLSFIGFLIVPYFAEGFDHVLTRILDGNYDQTYSVH